MGSVSIQHGLSKRFQFRQILFLEMGAVYPCKLCPFSLLARMKIEEKRDLFGDFLSYMFRMITMIGIISPMKNYIPVVFYFDRERSNWLCIFNFNCAPTFRINLFYIYYKN
ncbi:MAG: hypothetical protein TQ37_02745 [Candidatus Synechococcus spongiarum 15L]|uniref:Uncharacterized protein n=1 Tax=Candidatus Synechococcus spongiarum 15L TaxID=1608419 RepID=A0A0G8AX71_9SYNE|nr:MAG: hypothetical protein TQ37_02745 [Candidatus Synechococcus spongiarum 15L]